MISALAASMALVTVSYGGTVSVVPHISEHDCEEARSVALYGGSIESVIARERPYQIEELRSWLRNWPNVNPAWEKYIGQYLDNSNTVPLAAPGDIKTADCVD